MREKRNHGGLNSVSGLVAGGDQSVRVGLGLSRDLDGEEEVGFGVDYGEANQTEPVEGLGRNLNSKGGCELDLGANGDRACLEKEGIDSVDHSALNGLEVGLVREMKKKGGCKRELGAVEIGFDVGHDGADLMYVDGDDRLERGLASDVGKVEVSRVGDDIEVEYEDVMWEPNVASDNGLLEVVVRKASNVQAFLNHEGILGHVTVNSSSSGGMMNSKKRDRKAGPKTKKSKVSGRNFMIQ